MLAGAITAAAAPPAPSNSARAWCFQAHPTSASRNFGTGRGSSQSAELAPTTWRRSRGPKPQDSRLRCCGPLGRVVWQYDQAEPGQHATRRKARGDHVTIPPLHMTSWPHLPLACSEAFITFQWLMYRLPPISHACCPSPGKTDPLLRQDAPSQQVLRGVAADRNARREDRIELIRQNRLVGDVERAKQAREARQASREELGYRQLYQQALQLEKEKARRLVVRNQPSQPGCCTGILPTGLPFPCCRFSSQQQAAGRRLGTLMMPGGVGRSAV